MVSFSLAGSSNPPDDLIGDMLDSTDSSNVLGGFGLNSTAIPKSQQMQFGLTSVNLPALRGISGHQLCSFEYQQFRQLGINITNTLYLTECLNIIKAGKQISTKLAII